MSAKIRWGILSTGKIARVFAEALKVLPEAELVAVGSRSAESANQFGDQFRVPHRYATYQALVNDPDVDVIYVATPHALHRDNMLLCLQAGKSVLCEKPFTINAQQAEEVIAVARRQHLFVMEAMWTRFIPLVVRLRQMVADGVIGDVQMFVAGMATIANPDPSLYLLNPQLGGGILLDGGAYPISLASLFLGPPARIASMAHMGASGVDEQGAVILGYTTGQLANIYFSFKTRVPPYFALQGSRGRIDVHPPLFKPTKLTLTLFGAPEQIIEVPLEGNGMNYEAAEVMRCLHEGKTESAVMPLDETLSIMRTLDSIRAQWGFEYPMEHNAEKGVEL